MTAAIVLWSEESLDLVTFICALALGSMLTVALMRHRRSLPRLAERSAPAIGHIGTALARPSYRAELLDAPRDPNPSQHLRTIRGTWAWGYAFATHVVPDSRDPVVFYTPASIREERAVLTVLASRGLALVHARARSNRRSWNDPWAYRHTYVIRSQDGSPLPPR